MGFRVLRVFRVGGELGVLDLLGMRWMITSSLLTGPARLSSRASA